MVSSGYGIGVDLGGTSIVIGLFDIEENLIEKTEIPTDRSDNGSHILPDIQNAVRDFYRDRGISRDEILGIGIGVPGPVLADGTVNKCVNMGWGIINVKEQLEDMLGISVYVSNDGDAAALGEMKKGAGRGYDDVVMVELGTGVGGGIIKQGAPVVGNNGAAGEFGHICVNPYETQVCSCGNKGCLEQYTSSGGVMRHARKHYGDKFANVKEIFDQAKEGDEDALEIVEWNCEYLGRGLAAIAAVLDPQCIILGGGISKAGKFLTDHVRPYFEKYAFHAQKGKIELKIAKLSQNAAIYGCMALIMHALDEEDRI